MGRWKLYYVTVESRKQSLTQEFSFKKKNSKNWEKILHYCITIHVELISCCTNNIGSSTTGSTTGSTTCTQLVFVVCSRGNPRNP